MARLRRQIKRTHTGLIASKQGRKCMGSSNINMLRHVLLLSLLVVSTTAKSSSRTTGHGDDHADYAMPRWVQPRYRRLLASDLMVNKVVAKDGTGDATTIGAALAEVPAGKGRYVIHVRKGIYNETVTVMRRNIVILGDGIGETIITGNHCRTTGHDSTSSATVTVHGRGFMARDITVQNTAGPNMGPAVALRSNSVHSVFYRCSIQGFQDSLLADSGLQFYRDCEVWGTIDFIYGYAKAVFQNCSLLARRPAPGNYNVVTAQGRNHADHASGFSFQGCTVTALPGENLTGVDTFLGRPWKTFSRVVFMDTFLDSIVHPSGWIEWNKSVVVPETTRTVFYAEYKNRGPRSDVSKRVKWEGFKVITDANEAENYTVERFIDGSTWLPAGQVEYKLGL